MGRITKQPTSCRNALIYTLCITQTFSVKVILGATSTMAAAATVRGCSSKLAKRACHNLAFKPKQVQTTREILRLQGEQGLEPQLAKRACSNLAFVPQHKETQERDIELLQEFLNPSKRLLVLTGAGVTCLFLGHALKN